MSFGGRGILLDIEGTTSSASFVYDVMFPYVRRELPGFLAEHGQQPEVRAACEQMARDAGHAELNSWLAAAAATASESDFVVAAALRLMDADAKTTGLKELQGLVWRSGFHRGELRAHLYPDVVPALQQWQAVGLDVRIYSSGSVAAQLLFFGHTEYGDLRPLFRGHYDTRIGGKKEPASYRRIGTEFGLPPAEILFVSDVPAELDAAQATGLATALCRRPGNEAANERGHAEIGDFSQLHIAPRLDHGQT